jgi:hypothetical protein
MDARMPIPALRSLPNVLEDARGMALKRNVLSVYLATNPERVADGAHRDAYRIAVVHARHHIDLSDTASLADFDLQAARVATHIDRIVALGDPAIALFATSEEDLLVTPLPIRVPDRVVWGPRAVVTPLETALDECERVAVCLVDRHRARMLSIHLGQIDEQTHLNPINPDREPIGNGVAPTDARDDRPRQGDTLDHLVRTVHALTQELRTRPFDRLLIGGPDETRVMLQTQLTSPLRGRLTGTLSLPVFAPDADVLDAALVIAEQAEEQEELARVEALIDDLETGNVVTGQSDVFTALNDRRMHVLLLSTGLHGTGGACEVCGWIAPCPDPCPACGSDLAGEEDLRELIVSTAIAQGARVELVGSDAGALLDEHGGIGGWVRLDI